MIKSIGFVDYAQLYYTRQSIANHRLRLIGLLWRNEIKFLMELYLRAARVAIVIVYRILKVMTTFFFLSPPYQGVTLQYFTILNDLRPVVCNARTLDFRITSLSFYCRAAK